MSEISWTWISQIWGRKIRSERTFGANIGSEYPLANLIVTWSYRLENNTRTLSAPPMGAPESIARHVTLNCSFANGGTGQLNGGQQLWIEFLWNIRSPLGQISGSRGTTEGESSSSGFSASNGQVGVEAGSSESSSRTQSFGFQQSYIGGSAIYKKFVCGTSTFQHASSRGIRTGTEIQAQVGSNRESYIIYEHHADFFATALDGRVVRDSTSRIARLRAATAGAQ